MAFERRACWHLGLLVEPAGVVAVTWSASSLSCPWPCLSPWGDLYLLTPPISVLVVLGFAATWWLALA
ncbi:hypothetical protein SVIOM342S_05542 [Streptomyces violaceorubidus]